MFASDKQDLCAEHHFLQILNSVIGYLKYWTDKISDIQAYNDEIIESWISSSDEDYEIMAEF